MASTAHSPSCPLSTVATEVYGREGAWLTFPFFLGMLRSGEMSGNIGGLIRWPAALMMPLGFGAVFLQGVAEVIKRIAYLRGLIEMDTHYEKPVQ